MPRGSVLPGNAEFEVCPQLSAIRASPKGRNRPGDGFERGSRGAMPRGSVLPGNAEFELSPGLSVIRASPKGRRSGKCCVVLRIT